MPGTVLPAYSEAAVDYQRHQESLTALADFVVCNVVPDLINPAPLTSEDLHQPSGSYAEYGTPLPVWQLNARKLHIASILSDQALLFRFLRKSKFSLQTAQQTLGNHLRWRIQNNICSVCIDSLSPEIILENLAKEYARLGLMRYHGQDKYGRPCAILNLGKYDATAGKKCIEELREFLIFAFEVGRRTVSAANDSFQISAAGGTPLVPDLTTTATAPIPAVVETPATPLTAKAPGSLDMSMADRRGSHVSLVSAIEAGGVQQFPVVFQLPSFTTENGIKPFVAQMCVILDLDGVGMANLNYELVPLLFDLFHRQYPQVFGTIYVLNYGWLHSGIWSILKTMLPADACKKLLFLTKEELKQHFHEDVLLKEHGGSNASIYTLETCPYFTTYQTDPSPSQPLNFPSPQLLAMLGKLNSLDADPTIHHSAEDLDIWYDAPEYPVSPVKSAADLQTLLRSSSSVRNARPSRSASERALAGFPSAASLAAAAAAAAAATSPYYMRRDVSASSLSLNLKSPRSSVAVTPGTGPMPSPGAAGGLRPMHAPMSYFPKVASGTNLAPSPAAGKRSGAALSGMYGHHHPHQASYTGHAQLYYQQSSVQGGRGGSGAVVEGAIVKRGWWGIGGRGRSGEKMDAERRGVVSRFVQPALAFPWVVSVVVARIIVRGFLTVAGTARAGPKKGITAGQAAAKDVAVIGHGKDLPAAPPKSTSVAPQEAAVPVLRRKRSSVGGLVMKIGAGEHDLDVVSEDEDDDEDYTIIAAEPKPAAAVSASAVATAPTVPILTSKSHASTHARSKPWGSDLETAVTQVIAAAIFVASCIGAWRLAKRLGLGNLELRKGITAGAGSGSTWTSRLAGLMYRNVLYLGKVTKRFAKLLEMIEAILERKRQREAAMKKRQEAAAERARKKQSKDGGFDAASADSPTEQDSARGRPESARSRHHESRSSSADPDFLGTTEWPDGEDGVSTGHPALPSRVTSASSARSGESRSVGCAGHRPNCHCTLCLRKMQRAAAVAGKKARKARSSGTRKIVNNASGVPVGHMVLDLGVGDGGAGAAEDARVIGGSGEKVTPELYDSDDDSDGVEIPSRPRSGRTQVGFYARFQNKVVRVATGTQVQSKIEYEVGEVLPPTNSRPASAQRQPLFRPVFRKSKDKSATTKLVFGKQGGGPQGKSALKSHPTSSSTTTSHHPYLPVLPPNIIDFCVANDDMFGEVEEHPVPVLHGSYDKGGDWAKSTATASHSVVLYPERDDPDAEANQRSAVIGLPIPASQEAAADSIQEHFYVRLYAGGRPISKLTSLSHILAGIKPPVAHRNSAVSKGSAPGEDTSISSQSTLLHGASAAGQKEGKHGSLASLLDSKDREKNSTSARPSSCRITFAKEPTVSVIGVDTNCSTPFERMAAITDKDKDRPNAVANNPSSSNPSSRATSLLSFGSASAINKDPHASSGSLANTSSAALGYSGIAGNTIGGNTAAIGQTCVDGNHKESSSTYRAIVSATPGVSTMKYGGGMGRQQTVVRTIVAGAPSKPIPSTSSHPTSHHQSHTSSASSASRKRQSSVTHGPVPFQFSVQPLETLEDLNEGVSNINKASQAALASSRHSGSVGKKTHSNVALNTSNASDLALSTLGSSLALRLASSSTMKLDSAEEDSEAKPGASDSNPLCGETVLDPIEVEGTRGIKKEKPTLAIGVSNENQKSEVAFSETLSTASETKQKAQEVSEKCGKPPKIRTSPASSKLKESQSAATNQQTQPQRPANVIRSCTVKERKDEPLEILVLREEKPHVEAKADPGYILRYADLDFSAENLVIASNVPKASKQPNSPQRTKPPSPTVQFIENAASPQGNRSTVASPVGDPAANRRSIQNRSGGNSRRESFWSTGATAAASTMHGMGSKVGSRVGSAGTVRSVSFTVEPGSRTPSAINPAGIDDWNKLGQGGGMYPEDNPNVGEYESDWSFQRPLNRGRLTSQELQILQSIENLNKALFTKLVKISGPTP
ncbi:hypothetical protein HDU96_005802 [Phlyctochytrium bullatum]|nr:hypothetical protein HDU96_005802 [Phlyctochytrium bullatum]